MAPLRRYLRITKYSALECRIYLDNPALVDSWLLHPRDPVLPRVIESVRPLVLPKLIEERERARRKGTKKKGAIKDVLVEEDFEVSFFLTETDIRHSLLYKHRQARDKTQTRLVSNSSKLTGASYDAPIDVEADDLRIEIEKEVGRAGADGDDDDVVITAGRVTAQAPPTVLREDADESVGLHDVPDIHDIHDIHDGTTQRRASKRQRQQAAATVPVDDSDDDGRASLGGDDSDYDGHGDSGSDSREDAEASGPPAKRLRGDEGDATDPDPDLDPDPDADDNKKKKLAMDVVYEGFAIYGRVLCLVVKQRGPRAQARMPAASAQSRIRSGGSTSTSGTPARPAGQAVMENWIASTQAPPDAADTEA